MSSPQVSIIICTRNRAADLRLTLQSIGTCLAATDLATEVIVVDNGSTDETAAVAQKFIRNAKDARYVMAPKPGKGHAYNAGIAAAKGDILLWTDDDVRVPSNWIRDMAQPILDNRADAVAGGIVFPEHIARILSQGVFASHRGWFASHEYLDPRNPDAMIGANMAFHRRVLEKVPQFDVELGPGALGFRDESLFSIQLKAAGFRLVSNFDVAVEHHFDPKRATTSGLINTARGMGRSYAFIYHHWEHKRYRYARLRHALALLRLQVARLRERLSSGGKDDISDYRLRMEETVAFCAEIVKQGSQRRKYPLRGLAPIPEADR